jgi:hypothetical protein
LSFINKVDLESVTYSVGNTVNTRGFEWFACG